MSDQRRMSETELVKLLADHGVSTSGWGRNQAKTVKHLQKEIEAGETTFEITQSGELIRHTAFLSILVFYEDCQNEHTKYKLIEEKQVFSGGRERRRGQSWSVAEKLKVGEVDIKEATKRALSEELGIHGELQWSSEIEVKEETTDSPSYPGLKARFTSYALSVNFDRLQYKAEGYREVQEDKTTYFKWVPVK